MDNVFFVNECPSKMSDGRQPYDTLGQYHSADLTNNYLAKKLNARNEHDYRQKLIANGIGMLEKHKEWLDKNRSCQCNGCQCCTKDCVAKK